MMWMVSGSTIRTSFTARMLPYCGDFFFSLPGSVTRSNENFTSSAVSGSPLWNFTPRRSLNSHVVSLSAFHEVARDGSYSSFALRCRSESNMLMLTSTPTRSKCMCGSRVGACEASAIVSVSLGCACAANATASTSARASSGRDRGFMGASFVGGRQHISRRSARASGDLRRPRQPLFLRLVVEDEDHALLRGRTGRIGRREGDAACDDRAQRFGVDLHALEEAEVHVHAARAPEARADTHQPRVARLDQDVHVGRGGVTGERGRR